MNKEHKSKIYQRWVSALNRAKIPESCRLTTREDLKKMIVGGPEILERVSGSIFTRVRDWGRAGFIFIIDGDRSIGVESPADIRRKIGNTILQNGITYACQSSDYCPPYGLYVDYKMLISNVMNKEKSAAFIDQLCDQEFLFISEIYMSKNANEIMREIVSFKMDEIIRRRRDGGLATILSFSSLCKDLVGEEAYGEEVKYIIGSCGKNGTSVIESMKMVRITTSHGAIGGSNK